MASSAAIHKLVRKLGMKIINKGMALGTFLDIEGAFDNVSFDAIGRALSLNCSFDGGPCQSGSQRPVRLRR